MTPEAAAFNTATRFCHDLVADIDNYSFGYIGNVRQTTQGQVDDRLWGFFRKDVIQDPARGMVRAGSTGDIEALRRAYRIVRDELLAR